MDLSAASARSAPEPFGKGVEVGLCTLNQVDP
jgi:hypothetical protein